MTRAIREHLKYYETQTKKQWIPPPSQRKPEEAMCQLGLRGEQELPVRSGLTLPPEGEPEQMLSRAPNRLEMKPERQSAADEARRPVKRTDAITAQVREDKDGREGMATSCFSPSSTPVHTPHSKPAHFQSLV